MPEPTVIGPASPFESLPFPEDGYGEAFVSPGIARDHWQSLLAAFDGIAPDILNQRQERGSYRPTHLEARRAA